MRQTDSSNGSGIAVDGNPALTFFREWLRNPFAMAAVSPSGRRLAALMMEQLPQDAQRVIELGGGTGVFTRALLAHGVQPRNLLVVELNEALHQYLTERFPGVHVEQGDARQVHAIAQRCGVLDEHGNVDAVISGLGLLYMSRAAQREILTSAFDALAPEGRFIQFTYGPLSPVPRALLEELQLKAHRAGFVWRNMPPANVFVYQRRKSRKVESVRGKP
ncbi:MAG TPA: methyltransferase domain-containing protein [Rhodanobacteraceae bacterium]|nr:methyltransferase domain-containing protein [Rhodanobacteraceae bacterium]